VTRRPILIDFFSKAGGAAMGYHRAGFEVISIDIEPQPRNPFTFIQADAFAVFETAIEHADAIHGSPECRDHTPLTSRAGITGTGWQLARFIELCEASGKPYVVENVMAAQFPAEYPSNLVLCADRHFGLRTVRHRQFRCSGFQVPQPDHPGGWSSHSAPTATRKRYGMWDKGFHASVTGNIGTYVGPEAMGIDWMNGNELSQAIPPAYTEFVGKFLLTALDRGVQ
jgi:DNA (cytosine-5)-methyltransferase 1